MTPHPEREDLMAWRDGEVPAARAAEIGAHVAACADCRDFVSALGTLTAEMSRWQVDALPATLIAPPRSAPRGARRPILWAAAAVILIGVLATVRVECSPAPTCDVRTLRFAFMPDHSHPSALNASADAEQARPGTPQAFERDWLSRRRLPIKTAPGAKVTVVMFLDWQCPSCRMADRAYNVVFADFERRMPGAVTVQVRDYPLNIRCNPNVPVEMHPAACEAAVAVRLAREHGAAPALIDWLFANQATLTPDSVRQAASTIGKVPDFGARYGAIIKDVARDVTEAKGLEVGGTPTVFINGILARNNGGTSLFTPDEVRMAIDAELRRVR